jgi:gliding motility-associated-like protein
MKRLLSLIFFCLFFFFNINSQITLSHNVGTTPIKTDWTSCEDEEYWARTFTLSDFGISTTDQFIVRSGQIAVSNSYNGARLSIGVFAIDSNFPNSTATYIGGSSTIAPKIDDSPEILTINFARALLIPSGVERILVVASQSEDIYNSDFKKTIIAGTQQDNDTSWFKGCGKLYTYTPTENLDIPIPGANFFINITGEKLSTINSNTNLNLSHSDGDDIIETGIYGCSWGGINWARTFNLEDFGISENEEYIIKSGQIGLVKSSNWGVNIEFNIYEIDENFPTSFSEDKLIGKSKSVDQFGTTDNPNIMYVDFETPILIKSAVKRILVEAKQLSSSASSAVAFAAGTIDDNDFSWFKSDNGGCPPYNEYKKTIELSSSNINFYITVNGEAKTIFPFKITNNNNCVNFSNNFSLTNQAEIKSVLWNFDDPSSVVNNTSTSIDVSHQFSNPGIYTITADVLHTDGTNYTIPKKIEIFDAPIINSSVSLKQCDNSDINGFSFFNLNEVKEEIIINPENYTITFHEEKVLAENKGTAITNITKYKNEQVSVDKIWARTENSNGCYSVSKIDLFVSTTQIPATLLNSFYKCDDGANTTDGIATFDFSSVTTDIVNVFPADQQLIINYYRNEDDALAEENEIDDVTNYQNIGYPNQQNIYIRVDSKLDNDCLGLGAHISLNVEKVPVANSVSINPECDNDRDGFYSFNTSTIQSTIIGSQTNVAVNYFDENGTQLSSPLPNPFVTSSQTVTAKITNAFSQDLDGQCSDETIIDFIVNSVPIAHIIAPQEECDDDTDGIIGFNTSTIESIILNGQTGLIVTYFNESNVELQSPLPNPFYTTSKTIRVRLENPVYDICYEETTIDFIVRQKPTFDLIKEAILCITSNPQLEITIENPNSNNTYTWKDENNITISNQTKATVVKGGIYKVIATSKYGCNSEEQKILVRESSVATITINDIEVQDDSENNNIQISTSNLGLGNYEFRLLDENENIVFDYQEQPYFENLKGGVYTIEVNDENGCGKTPFEVSLLEFPHFFTPNNDGENDTWQIKGISKNFYKIGKISIFNRYGKLISTFTIADFGWDGTYNGTILSTNDYWFYAELVDQKDVSRNRKGNFSLIRK